MTAILGISGLYHDSAAAIVVDGEIIAAAQEERFTRVKHDPAMPENAIQYCVDEAGLQVGDLDYVGFYDKPLLTFERLLETWVGFAPFGFPSFIAALPVWIKQKLHIPREIKKALGGEYKRRIVFTQHHESHAASAFFPSPYEEAAILTVDGVGEWATATVGTGRGNRIELHRELRFPHSLGLIYTAFTAYCGFKVNSGEYKLMGLAPYGEPTYADAILKNLIDLKDDGSFRMDMSYFRFCTGLTMTTGKFHNLFGGPPRKSESDLEQRHMDLAASIQKVAEEILLRMARYAHSVTGMKHLVMAGGVALNCVANGRILRETEFEDIWIQPAAGDAGGALGVAQFIWHQLLDKPRVAQKPDGQSASYLGPAAQPDHVELFLNAQNAVYQKFDKTDELCRFVAEQLANENVVGWMQGRMEFGPRALGGRSILGDARSTEMQSVMNLKIKFRESFRPFAPSILQERAHEFFKIDPQHSSPYMLLVADVCEDKRTNANEDQSRVKGLDKLNVVRSTVPAITHVDNSARVQTVDADRHDRYYKLLKEFEKQTGSPVLINTSFNVRGEPIVCSPADAWNCFMATNMDVLVIGDYVMLKKDQPNAIEHDPAEYLSKFKLD